MSVENAQSLYGTAEPVPATPSKGNYWFSHLIRDIRKGHMHPGTNLPTLKAYQDIVATTRLAENTTGLSVDELYQRAITYRPQRLDYVVNYTREDFSRYIERWALAMDLVTLQNRQDGVTRVFGLKLRDANLSDDGVAAFFEGLDARTDQVVNEAVVRGIERR